MLHPRLVTIVTIVTIVTTVASLTVGCVDGTLPPVTSLADPSNPAAPEAPFSPPPALFGATNPTPGAASAAPLGQAVYVCPMHPQIARDAPGACPICGMTLVPRPRTEPRHDHHDHEGAK
jgi:hypothetical protein